MAGKGKSSWKGVCIVLGGHDGWSCMACLRILGAPQAPMRMLKQGARGGGAAVGCPVAQARGCLRVGACAQRVPS